VSRLLHLVTVAALTATLGIVGAGWIAWLGVFVAAALLAYEHSLVAPDDLTKLDAAFFTMNGIISITVFAFVLGDRLIG
jgi:4-hydroxybenzoate polyprenyltransferase